MALAIVAVWVVAIDVVLSHATTGKRDTIHFTKKPSDTGWQTLNGKTYFCKYYTWGDVHSGLTRVVVDCRPKAAPAALTTA